MLLLLGLGPCKGGANVPVRGVGDASTTFIVHRRTRWLTEFRAAGSHPNLKLRRVLRGSSWATRAKWQVKRGVVDLEGELAGAWGEVCFTLEIP